MGFLELPPREWSLPEAWEPHGVLVPRWEGQGPGLASEYMGSEVVTVSLITVPCTRPNIASGFLYCLVSFEVAHTEQC